MLGIVGESGSGKSVTCRSIRLSRGAAARIAGGTAMFEGGDLLACRRRSCAGSGAVAMIFQNPSAHSIR